MNKATTPMRMTGILEDMGFNDESNDADLSSPPARLTRTQGLFLPG